MARTPRGIFGIELGTAFGTTFFGTTFAVGTMFGLTAAPAAADVPRLTLDGPLLPVGSFLVDPEASEGQADGLSRAMLQPTPAGPQQDDRGRTARPTALSAAEVGPSRRGHPYVRGGFLIRFPEDTTIVSNRTVQNVDGQAVEQVTTVEQTLGWGGGLYAAFGYDFRTGILESPTREGLRPRVELEYALLLADFRGFGFNEIGYTQNSLGLNGILTYEAVEGFKPYVGVGGGASYVSFSRLGTQALGGNQIAGGDEITFYAQGLFGLLIRFDEYTEIDLGARYKVTSLGIDNFEDDLNTAVFHVGLVFRLK